MVAALIGRLSMIHESSPSRKFRSFIINKSNIKEFLLGRELTELEYCSSSGKKPLS